MDENTSCAYTASTSSSHHNQPIQLTECTKEGEQHYTKRPQNDSIEVWHHRFCHINTHTLRQTEKAVYDMKIQYKKTNKFFREGCVFEKQQRSTYHALPEKERDTIPNTFFHIDLCGPMSTVSLGGASYFMLCKDNSLGHMVIFFLKANSEAIRFFKQLYALVQQELHIDIQRIRTDQAGEFKSHQFQDFTQEKGILHEFFAAYASE